MLQENGKTTNSICIGRNKRAPRGGGSAGGRCERTSRQGFGRQGDQAEAPVAAGRCHGQCRRQKSAGRRRRRRLTVTSAADKDYVVVVVTLVPNNYTTITRSRKVVAKEGEVVVDLRKPSDTEKDDIVVRFVPTPDDVVAAMCKAAKVGKEDVVYDLGCGDGRMVINAVKDFGAQTRCRHRPRSRAGQEVQKAAADAGVADKVQFRVGDVLKVDDMSDATVVLLYMGDDINARLKPILQKTLKPGSRVVSHRFLMGDDWRPDRTETIHSSRGL